MDTGVGCTNWLCIQPDEGLGVASGLVKYAVECLRNLGCEKLNLQVREGNAAAESFYESLGFIKEPRTSMGKLLS